MKSTKRLPLAKHLTRKANVGDWCVGFLVNMNAVTCSKIQEINGSCYYLEEYWCTTYKTEKAARAAYKKNHH